MFFISFLVSVGMLQYFCGAMVILHNSLLIDTGGSVTVFLWGGNLKVCLFVIKTFLDKRLRVLSFLIRRSDVFGQKVGMHTIQELF